MSTLAISLPRIRRFRRPPARVVLHAAEALISAIFVICCVILGSPLLLAISVVHAVTVAMEWRSMHRAIDAWLADRPVAPVARWQWRWLIVRSGLVVFQVVAMLLS